MRSIIAISALALLSACGNSNDTSKQLNEDLTANASNQALPPAPPSHNYTQKIKGVYYYVSAVSDEDKKQGKASGDALGFKYLGQNSDGEFVLGFVDDDGDVISKSYCLKPCSVIREGAGGRYGFSEDSVIGSAFIDAFNGQLEVAGKKPKSAP